jgi:hypothetical protein
LKHYASPRFWECYEQLSPNIRKLADRCFKLLKDDPYHPSLHYKKIGEYHSVRIGLHHRALAIEIPEGLLWFWIGSHADYDKLLENL